MNTTIVIAVIGLSLLSGITSLIGVWLGICCSRKVKAIVFGMGFAIGIMLLISGFELIPEALHGIGITKTIIGVITGVIIVWLLNRLVPHTHLIKEERGEHKQALKVAYLVAFGLILHDFPEGFAMASSYILSPSLGILIAIAIALHNIPEEFAMAVPFCCANKPKKFLYKMAFYSALAEPLGAVLGLLAVGLFPVLNVFFIALAAGAMIFISIHELWPLAKRYHNPHFFWFGLLFSGIIYFILTTFIPE